MESLYPDDEPTTTLTNGLDLNDLKNPNTEGVEFEVQDESKTQEKDTDVYQVFNADDVYKNMYQDDSSADDDEVDTFDRIRKKMADISGGDGGVMKRILSPGAGNPVTPDALVRIHYNLYLEGSDEPFDSTRLRGQEFKFRLGQDVVIGGLEISVSSMKKGEKSQYIFTPDYAYGKMGCGSRIPGNSHILAEIELLSFVEQEGVDDFYNMTELERKNISLDKIMKVCKAHKDDGKACFQSKQFQRAFTRYKKATDVLQMYHLKNEKEEKEQEKMLLKLYLNLSLCCLNLCHSGRAIVYCKKVLQLDPRNCKALFRFGKALRQLQEFPQARQYLLQAQRIEPHNTEINQALIELDRIVKKNKAIEETFCRKMFSANIKDDTGTVQESEQKSNESELFEVSAEFQKEADKVLKDFHEDTNSMEMPFPPAQLTVPEINCILETAVKYGLDVRQYGTGSNMEMKIVKKRPDNPDKK